jgi:hypothetical protein
MSTGRLVSQFAGLVFFYRSALILGLPLHRPSGRSSAFVGRLPYGNAVLSQAGLDKSQGTSVTKLSEDGLGPTVIGNSLVPIAEIENPVGKSHARHKRG